MAGQRATGPVCDSSAKLRTTRLIQPAFRWSGLRDARLRDCVIGVRDCAIDVRQAAEM
jgi:hypothetical protein